MLTRETFIRPAEVAREPCHLPAETYRLAYLLRQTQAADTGCLFVPIRSLQYLAVLDAEEFIFVDREARRLIEVSWQQFRPQVRHALTDPVPYELVFYHPKGRETQRRLPMEFLKALLEMEKRLRPGTLDGASDTVVPWPGADR